MSSNSAKLKKKKKSKNLKIGIEKKYPPGWPKEREKLPSYF
jgi:hypothetical protein